MMKPSREAIYEKAFEFSEIQSEKGFTLIEVLIAMAILAVGLLAIATMQISAIRVNSTARNITERSTHAQDKLEELVAKQYTDPELSITDGGDPHEDSDPPDGFNVSWTVTTGPSTNTLLITVSVDEGGTVTRVSYVKPQVAG